MIFKAPDAREHFKMREVNCNGECQLATNPAHQSFWSVKLAI